MVVQGRPSIHPDTKLGSDQETNQNLLQCESCKKRCIVTEETETELDDSETEGYVEIQKKKYDSDIDLEKLPTFKCKGCKSPKGAPSSKWSVMLSLIGCCLAVILLFGTGFYIYNTYWDDIMYFIKRGENIPVVMDGRNSADTWLDNKLDAVEKSYTSQYEDTWITFAAGIKSVMKEPNKPSSFLLLFDSESAEKTAQCIAQDVSKQAIAYIMRRYDTPSIINGADLNKKNYLEDPGQFLKDINDTVREKGALVVTNLHEVPPNVVRMFHYLSDTYTPLVEKAVAFYTLKVKKLPTLKDQKKTADETMMDLWSSELSDNILRPLITRMTTNIVLIFPDKSC